MSYSRSNSPGMKVDLKYQSPNHQKRQHPFSIEASQQSLKNSITFKGNDSKDFRSSLDIPFSEELEYYKQRCQDLDNYVKQLKGELDLTIMRLTKTGELDSKVELVLKQNQALSNELDRSQKSVAQKKTECDLWKQKYENQLNQAVQMKAAFELDLRKLSQELQNVDDQNQILQKEKENIQSIFQKYNILQVHCEQQRQSFNQQIEILEAQLRKFRDYAEEKESEVYDIQIKLERQANDADKDQQRLARENEQLRSRIQDKEIEAQNELNNLRQKLEFLSQSTLDNLRGQFTTQIEILMGESHKLKELLEIKNAEIETLIVQNQKQRSNFEEEIATARMQFEVLKDKMMENEHHFEEMLNRQDQSYMMERNQFEKRFTQEIGMLEDQLSQMQKFNDNLQNDLKQVLQEKQLLKDQYENALQLGRQEREQLRKDSSIQLQNLNEMIQQNYEKYQNQLKTMQEFSDEQRNQIDYLRKQIALLEKLLKDKEEQMNGALDSFAKIKNKLDNDFLSLRQKYEQLYLKSQTIEMQKNKIIEENKLKQSNLEQKIRETTLNQNNQIEQLRETVQRLKSSIDVKDKEIESYLQQRQMFEKEARRLKEEMEQQKLQANELFSNKISELEGKLRQQELEDQHYFEGQIIDYQQKIDALMDELSEARAQLEIRTKEIFELSEKFLILENSLKESREDSRINITLGDIQATKTVYESFGFKKSNK